MIIEMDINNESKNLAVVPATNIKFHNIGCTFPLVSNNIYQNQTI